jgi:hypothetical protein
VKLKGRTHDSDNNSDPYYAVNPNAVYVAADAALAGDRIPDIANDVSYLDATLRIPLTPRLSARLVYRNQWEKIRDWHYRGIDATPVVAANPANPPTVVLIDGGPMNYHVEWYGVMLQIKL